MIHFRSREGKNLKVPRSQKQDGGNAARCGRADDAEFIYIDAEKIFEEQATGCKTDCRKAKSKAGKPNLPQLPFCWLFMWHPAFKNMSFTAPDARHSELFHTYPRFFTKPGLRVPPHCTKPDAAFYKGIVSPFLEYFVMPGL
jgi:hypothetical protein